MDLRGAKSNVMSLFGIYRNRNCPLVALMHAWPRMPAALLQQLMAPFLNPVFPRLIPVFFSSSAAAQSDNLGLARRIWRAASSSGLGQKPGDRGFDFRQSR